ncbi:Epidermal patterning factor-like protein [Quillaja saponaria]|uniref:Epidermal patterning factor-like protein n=1 Tax=Quillaja saponaria TaxID=32244 RepID=A0AAD7PGL0_QUISA|nr:Epidermal patterning factor-like protein [Quillaja saponaria]
MGLYHHRSCNHQLPALTFVSFLLFSFDSALTLTQPSKPINKIQPNQLLTVSNGKISGGGLMGLQNKEGKPSGSVKERTLTEQKKNVGTGSQPPSCTSKCGSCSPCYPVLVTIPPGLSITLEYYPEAWRCKCGDKLFTP